MINKIYFAYNNMKHTVKIRYNRIEYMLSYKVPDFKD